MRKIAHIFVAFSEKLNCTNTNVVIFKTGKKCVRIQIRLTGKALKKGHKRVIGQYKRLKRPFNDKAMYQHLKSKRTYIWWDTPKTLYQDKENSKGNDRSHWKIGDRKLQLGFLDTYKSPRQSGLVYSRRNKWSYYVLRPGALGGGYWVDQCPNRACSADANREISVKCVRKA